MSLPNKKRGEVALPGHPEGRCIRLTLDVKERLQAKYATEDRPDWVSFIYDRIGIPDPVMMREILETAIVGDEPFDAKQYIADSDVVDSEIVDAIRDALTLSLHGRTVQEHLDYLAKRDEEAQEKKLQKVKAEMVENGIPAEDLDQMIFLKKLEALLTDPVSNQQRSEN